MTAWMPAKPSSQVGSRTQHCVIPGVRRPGHQRDSGSAKAGEVFECSALPHNCMRSTGCIVFIDAA